MATHREFWVRDEALQIYDHSEAYETDTGKPLVGASLWDCSLVLSKWFETDSWPEGSLTAIRVIELGAGLGLVGLAVAAGGADVTITDRAPYIAAIERNIEANFVKGHARAMVYEWASDCAALKPPFDIILGSDVMYDVSAMPALCSTWLALSDVNTRIYVACELREGLKECFSVLREKGFTWRKVQNTELHPEWKSEDLGVFQICRPDK